MQQVAGSLSTDGSSGVIFVPPGETCTVALSVAGGDSFEGVVAVETSRDAGLSWQAAEDVDGTALRFVGTSGAPLTDGIAVATVRNTDIKTRSYRVTARAIEADAVVYDLAEVVGEALEVVLRDQRNRPLLLVRDDGGLEVLGPLVVSDLRPGDITFVDGVAERAALVSIASDDITGTSAGQLGHANGYPLVAAPGADKAIELVSVVMVNDRDTAAYGGGGNVTVNWAAGGAALTGLVSAANSLGAAADTRHLFVPLATAAIPLVANAGLNLVAASAFTQPGTAAGVLRLAVRYRVHDLGLA